MIGNPLPTRAAAVSGPVFPLGAPAFVAPTRASALSVARYSSEVGEGGLLETTMPPEDAYVALFQLRDHPSHEFWFEGKRECTAPAARGSLHIVDLRGEPLAHLREPVDTLMFHLPRAVLDEIAEEAGAARIDTLAAPEPWNTPDPVVGQLQGLIVDSIANPRPADRLLHDHLLFGLASHFVGTYGGMRPRAPLIRGGLAPWQERRAKELLSANLAKEMSLQDIAHECGLSLAYFTRAFKASTGATPHGWRQSCRVARAKELLLTPGIALAEVATDCGFADQSHFNRVFARATGVTPGAWRRQVRES